MSALVLFSFKSQCFHLTLPHETDSLENRTNPYRHTVCCGLNFWGFNFDFPLSSFHYHNLWQRKIKIKLVWKFFKPKIIWTTTYITPYPRNSSHLLKNLLAPVVRKADNFIQWINHYLANKMYSSWCILTTAYQIYLLDKIICSLNNWRLVLLTKWNHQDTDSNKQ